MIILLLLNYNLVKIRKIPVNCYATIGTVLLKAKLIKTTRWSK
jgi:hypothetical protein